MNERGGAAATIALLIAAVLGVSFLPRKGGENQTGSEAQRAGARPSVGATRNATQSPAKEKPIASCEQIAKRLHRFYPADQQAPIPGSCYSENPSGASNPPPRTKSNLHFAIAIVPNPVQTHLPLLFDRAIESTQQAAQDVNYIYDGSWFPWNHSDKSYESLSDEEQAAKLEAELQEQPGIMVFRRGFDNEKVDDTWSKCETGPGSGVVKPNCLESKDGEFANHYERDLVVFVVAE